MSSSDSLSTTSVAELLSRADGALTQGDRQGAIGFLRSACDMDAGNAELRVALGNILLENCDYRSAGDEYREAIRLRPRSDVPYGVLALACHLAGDVKSADDAAFRALVLNPANNVALKVLARINIDKGEFGRAQEFCKRILAHSPDDADALRMQMQCAVQTASHGTAFALAGDFTSRTQFWSEMGAEHILQQLVVGLESSPVVVRKAPASGTGCSELPLPPADLRMGYGGNSGDHYLRIGERSYQSLRRILEVNRINLGSGDAMLDWGCASGRVVRFFAPMVEQGVDVWGGDVHVPSILWARDNLKPVRFFTCSALPHLPFRDGKFTLIYALSVLTHIVGLRDMWLLELSRVLKPGGYAILTVHTEHTWSHFATHGMPSWMPDELRGLQELPGESVDIQGSTWNQTYTFFSSEYIRRIWGQYFDVVDIVPAAEAYQTAVVLRNR